MTTNSVLKPAIDKVLVEKRALKIEEKALNEALAKLKAQLTQLQVEALEIRARARQQNQQPVIDSGWEEKVQPNRSSDPNQMDLLSKPTSSPEAQKPQDINKQQLELSVADPDIILRKVPQRIILLC